MKVHVGDAAVFVVCVLIAGFMGGMQVMQNQTRECPEYVQEKLAYRVDEANGTRSCVYIPHTRGLKHRREVVKS